MGQQERNRTPNRTASAESEQALTPRIMERKKSPPNKFNHLQQVQSVKIFDSRMSPTSEHFKKKRSQDFETAYFSLVQKMYRDQGQQISGLLTEEELQKLHQRKQFDHNQFLERQEFYNKIRNEKIMALMNSKVDEDL